MSSKNFCTISGKSRRYPKKWGAARRAAPHPRYQKNLSDLHVVCDSSNGHPTHLWGAHKFAVEIIRHVGNSYVYAQA